MAVTFQKVPLGRHRGSPGSEQSAHKKQRRNEKLRCTRQGRCHVTSRCSLEGEEALVTLHVLPSPCPSSLGGEASAGEGTGVQSWQHRHLLLLRGEPRSDFLARLPRWTEPTGSDCSWGKEARGPQRCHRPATPTRVWTSSIQEPEGGPAKEPSPSFPTLHEQHLPRAPGEDGPRSRLCLCSWCGTRGGATQAPP